MIPIKFLIIFRELCITQCLRSHTHRQQHLWHILDAHPYALTLSAELQHWAICSKEIRCKVQNGKWKGG